MKADYDKAMEVYKSSDVVKKFNKAVEAIKKKPKASTATRARPCGGALGMSTRMADGLANDPGGCNSVVAFGAISGCCLALRNQALRC